MSRTLSHIKLKSQNFLKRIDFDIIQDEEKLILKIDQSCLWSPTAILPLAVVTFNIILLHILIPSMLKMWEQLTKLPLSQTGHGKEKFRMLFDLMVGKHHPIPLEEEKRIDK